MHPSVPPHCAAPQFMPILPMAVRLFAPEPRICEVVPTPFFRGHPRVTRKTRTLETPFVSAAYSTTHAASPTPPFCNLTPQGRSDPAMELDQSRRARRRVIGRVIGCGSKCKCKCKTFLRLLDRRMKAKSDAPLCSIFVL